MTHRSGRSAVVREVRSRVYVEVSKFLWSSFLIVSLHVFCDTRERSVDSTSFLNRLGRGRGVTPHLGSLEWVHVVNGQVSI